MTDWVRSAKLLDECRELLSRFLAIGPNVFRFADSRLHLRKAWQDFKVSLGSHSRVGYFLHNQDEFWVKPFDDADGFIIKLIFKLPIEENSLFFIPKPTPPDWIPPGYNEEEEENRVRPCWTFWTVPPIDRRHVDLFDHFVRHFRIFVDNEIAVSREPLNAWLEDTRLGLLFWGEQNYAPVAKEILRQFRPEMFRLLIEAMKTTGEDDPLVALALITTSESNSDPFVEKKRRGRPKRVLTQKELRDMETIRQWIASAKGRKVTAKAIAKELVIKEVEAKELMRLLREEKRKAKRNNQATT